MKETPVDASAAAVVMLAMLAAVILAPPVRAEQQTIPTGMVGWWPGNGSAADQAGPASGQLVGPVYYTPAMGRLGFIFNGKGGEVLIPDAPEFQIGGSLTLAAWVDAQPMPSAGQIFFRGDNRGALDPIYLAVQTGTDGTTKVRFHLESNTQSADLSAPLPVRQFAHVAGVFNAAAGEMRVYINGQPAAAMQTAVRPIQALDRLHNPGLAIGNTAEPALFNEPFHGIIADVRLYNRALSPAEIQAVADDRTPARPSAPTAGTGSSGVPSDWIRTHVGVLYWANQASDGQDLDDMTDIAERFDPPAVTIWVDAKAPHSLARDLATPVYRRIFSRFHVVKLNICHSYMAAEYSSHQRPMQAVLQDVEQDYYEATRFLAETYRGQDRVFLLCYCQELNDWFDRPGALPDFPLVDYVSAGHRGMVRALAEAGSKMSPEIHDLVEVQFFLDFQNWVARFIPHMPADLFGLTYYPNGMTLTEQLDYLSRFLPGGPVHNRVVLSEFGEQLDLVGFDERKQLKWVKDMVHDAQQWGVRYAFYYQLADVNSVVRSAGYHGLQGPPDGPALRLVGEYFYRIWQGENDPVLPDRHPEQTMATIPWALHNNLPDLVVTDVYGVPSDPRPGEQVHFTVGIKNIGGGPTHGSILVDVEVDGHYVGAASRDGSLPPGGTIELEILRAGPRNYWTATPGTHIVTATVNSRRAVEEADYSAASNSLSRTIRATKSP